MLPPWGSKLLDGIDVRTGTYDEVSGELEEDFKHGLFCFDRPFEEWQAPGTEILVRLRDEVDLPWDSDILYVCLPDQALVPGAFVNTRAHAGASV